MRNWKPDIPRAGIVALLLLCGGCGETPPPEQRVRDFIAELEQLAEAREYAELLDRIAGDYLDTRGNDKLKVAGILRAFYLRNKSVHLFIRIGEIRLPTPDRASATLFVAMARRPLTTAEAAGLPETDMHHIEVELAADGDSYEILQTEWRRTAATNILF